MASDPGYSLTTFPGAPAERDGVPHVVYIPPPVDSGRNTCKEYEGHLVYLSNNSSLVIHSSSSLSYQETIPLPAPPTQRSRFTTSEDLKVPEENEEEGEEFGGIYFDGERNILAWRAQNLYIFHPRPSNPSNLSSPSSPKTAWTWALHSELKITQQTGGDKDVRGGTGRGGVREACLAKNTIVVSTASGVELWRLDESLAIPIWNHITILTSQPVLNIDLSPCANYIAYTPSSITSNPGSSFQSAVTSVIIRDISPTQLKKDQASASSTALTTTSSSSRLRNRTIGCRRLKSHAHARGTKEEGTEVDATMEEERVGQEVRHPCEVLGVRWRRGGEDSIDQPALYTYDNRNTLRLYTPIVDEPSFFQLVANVRLAQPRSSRTPVDQNQKPAKGKGREFPLVEGEGGDEIRWKAGVRVEGSDEDVWNLAIEGLGAKPPQVIRLGKTSSARLSSFKDNKSPSNTQRELIATSSTGKEGGRRAIWSDRDPTTGICHIRSAELGQEEGVKSVLTGMKGDIVLMRQAFDVVLTLSARGELGVWRSTSKGLDLERIITLDRRTAKNITDLTLLAEQGPILYTAGTTIKALDLATGDEQWQSRVSRKEGSAVKALKVLGKEALVVYLEDGSAVWAQIDLETSTLSLDGFSPLCTTDESSSSGRKYIPDMPLGHEEVLSIREGRLEWSSVKEGKLTREHELRVGREDFSISAVAGKEKVACVSDGDLIVWDVSDAEFANAAEYVEKQSEPILDLNWTYLPGKQQLALVITTGKSLKVLTQGRSVPDELNTAWTTLVEASAASVSPYPFTAAARTADGRVIVSARNQLFHIALVQQRLELAEARQISLPEFHRFNVEQCMVWDKQDAVDLMLHRLNGLFDGKQYQPLVPEDYWQSDQAKAESPDDIFASSRREHDRLADMRDGSRGKFPNLNEANLAKLSWSRKQIRAILRIQSVLEVLGKETGHIDAFARRYLTALYMRASSDIRPPVPFRYVVWAMHSQRQVDLLRISADYWENRRLTWSEAKRIGTPYWLNDPEALRHHTEQIGRNEFLETERDPIPCSLFYFALGKKSTVLGLWRQANGHSEQGAMLRFLANDFTQPRWQGAAVKNAYALLSKQRFQYAAAFFILGGQYPDAIRICLRQLDDPELAMLLARLLDTEGGSLLEDIVRTTVLPNAKMSGDRWLAYWCLWSLGERQEAIRSLILPSQRTGLEPADSALPARHLLSGSADYLALYSELKSNPLYSKTCQDAINYADEWDIVIKRIRRLRQMGFESLSLTIAKEWGFAHAPVVSNSVVAAQAASTAQSSVAGFTDFNFDDFGAPPPSRSGPRAAPAENPPPPAKISLFKSDKQVDTRESQGGLEFDMNSFF